MRPDSDGGGAREDGMRDRRVAIIAGVGAGLAAAVDRALSREDGRDRHVVRIEEPRQDWPE
jgi:hypothetical protein